MCRLRPISFRINANAVQVYFFICSMKNKLKEASSSNYQKTGLSLAEMFFPDVNAMIILNEYIYNHKYTLQIVMQ